MVTGLVRTMAVVDTMRMVSSSLPIPTFMTVAILFVPDPACHVTQSADDPNDLAFVSAEDPEDLALLLAEP